MPCDMLVGVLKRSLGSLGKLGELCESFEQGNSTMALMVAFSLLCHQAKC